MKIAIAQLRPRRGDIEANITAHQRMIKMAVSKKADMIVFPELSLTGYEPSRAATLALRINDERLKIFQELSDATGIRIGVGLPTPNHSGTMITLLVFQPDEEPFVYSKKFLHADEMPFFLAGTSAQNCLGISPRVGFAICYELSSREHWEMTIRNGASIYIASVAKSRPGIDCAADYLSATARSYRMPVLMANATGPAEDFSCAGRSSVWNRDGVLIAELGADTEGIIVFDSDSSHAERIWS